MHALPSARAEKPGYLPAMEGAGCLLRVREPEWSGHRMFRGQEREVNLHAFSRGCPKAGRMPLSRDWLRIHGEDLNLYAQAKRRLARRSWK